MTAARGACPLARNYRLNHLPFITAIRGAAMPTSSIPQNTDFTRDVLGRYVCNGLDEALVSSDPSLNPNARPFDVIVVGGGSFGPILAQHLLYADQARSRRTLVLEAGRLVLTEHVQNLPILGLNVPGPI
jgi:hypothetical protein